MVYVCLTLGMYCVWVCFFVFCKFRGAKVFKTLQKSYFSSNYCIVYISAKCETLIAQT